MAEGLEERFKEAWRPGSLANRKLGVKEDVARSMACIPPRLDRESGKTCGLVGTDLTFRGPLFTLKRMASTADSSSDERSSACHDPWFMRSTLPRIRTPL